MVTIKEYKLEVKGLETLDVEGLIKVLSVSECNDDIMLYALVDIFNKKTTTITLFVTSCKENLDVVADWRFLGTVNLFDGDFIFHIFMKNEK